MIASVLTRPLTGLLDLVLPPRCAVCRDIVTVDASLCAACWPTLSFITEPLCDCCGTPFSFATASGQRCGACLAKPPGFAAARAPFVYDGAARAIALGYKLGDRQHLAGLMAGHMVRAGASWLGQDAVLVPVPLHRWRLLRRGFNQAALLAQAIGRQSATPVAIDALSRRHAAPSSRGMNRRQRAANVARAFHVERGDTIRDRAVILVDDVFTTGATAGACTGALQRAGARTVHVLTFARVVRDGS